MIESGRVPKAGRRVILVVGMHRSGTSAVTRVLNLLGAELPGALVPAGSGNDLGHWESAEAVALHDRMLWSAGVNVNGVFGIRPEWFESPEAAEHVAAVADFVSTHAGEAALLAVKDPRMARFVPIWLRALDRLGMEALFVSPFRHPMEVALSMQRRQLRHFTDSVWPLGRGALLWQRYVLTAEAATRGRPRAFVQFDALLEDPSAEMARIARQLRVDWPRAGQADAEIAAFLSREHKHENTTAPVAGSPWIGRVYEQMLKCVDAPQGGAEVFDAAMRSLREGSGLFEEYVRALEAKIASIASLNTEFPDFPPPDVFETEDREAPPTPPGRSPVPLLKRLLSGRPA